MNKVMLRELIRGKEITLQDAELMGNILSVHPDYPIKYVVRGDNPIHYFDPVFPVCLLEEALIAKLKGQRGNLLGLQIEAELQSKAHNDNVPVPYVKGMYNIYNVSTKSFVPSLVMERVNGKTLSQITSIALSRGTTYRERMKAKMDMEKAYKQRNLAVRLSEHQGYVVSNDRPNDNAMFDDRQKLYLIDTEYWKFVGAQPAD